MIDSVGPLIAELLGRCRFPQSGSSADCAFSGGADSTALLILAREAGLRPVAHHVDHGIRPTSGDEARRAASIAESLGIDVEVHEVTVEPGPNLEARAREARLAAIPAGSMTGHTADDQAETVLLRLLRGSGPTGLAAMRPGPEHPILGLRRSETVELCRRMGIDPIVDESNSDPSIRRNRVRSELLPLLADISERDPVPLLVRTATLSGAEGDLLDRLSRHLDPTDCRALREAEPVLA
ncbi:MAG: tRNA lysidine(34) synthetase TilS, partial [Ilumatobacteraceae bacterium]